MVNTLVEGISCPPVIPDSARAFPLVPTRKYKFKYKIGSRRVPLWCLTTPTGVRRTGLASGSLINEHRQDYTADLKALVVRPARSCTSPLDAKC